MPDPQTRRELKSLYPFAVITLLCVVILVACFTIRPEIDLVVSSWFYTEEHGFRLAQHPLFLFLHGVALYGSWGVGVVACLGALFGYFLHRDILVLKPKAWLFLLLTLLIGPVLIANVLLKDHWGRARPRDVSEFGGSAHFTPPLQPSHECQHNCSFVSGEGAFGFYLPTFAYVAPQRSRRRVFQLGMAFGCIFGVMRIAMGGHFLSDVIFAALAMLLSSAIIYSLMFGSKSTLTIWKSMIFYNKRTS